MGGSYANWLIDAGVAAVLIAMVVAISMASRYRASIGWMAANLAVWVVIAGIFITVYVYQVGTTQTGSAVPATGLPPAAALQAAATAAPPPATLEPDASSLRIFAGGDGHYRVDGLVNGATMPFLVDTGASVVLLTADDARRAGINPDSLQYLRQIATPNGTLEAADIVIYQLAIGPIRLVNVAGAVVRANTIGSLLGMSFLSRISGYEVSDGVMTLRK